MHCHTPLAGPIEPVPSLVVTQVLTNRFCDRITTRQRSTLISLVSGAFYGPSFGPHSISFGLCAVSSDVVDFSLDFFKLFLVGSLTPRVVSSA